MLCLYFISQEVWVAEIFTIFSVFVEALKRKQDILGRDLNSLLKILKKFKYSNEYK